jgi:hypothetical protein
LQAAQIYNDCELDVEPEEVAGESRQHPVRQMCGGAGPLGDGDLERPLHLVERPVVLFVLRRERARYLGQDLRDDRVEELVLVLRMPRRVVTTSATVGASLARSSGSA